MNSNELNELADWAQNHQSYFTLRNDRENMLKAAEQLRNMATLQFEVITLRAQLDGEGTRLEQARAEAESLRAQLNKFEEAMQRERKADWEQEHMDLADTIDSLDKHTWEAELKQKVEHAASELRYMATSFTLKANFVLSELRMAELERQNQEMRSVIKSVYDWGVVPPSEIATKLRNIAKSTNQNTSWLNPYEQR